MEALTCIVEQQHQCVKSIFLEPSKNERNIPFLILFGLAVEYVANSSLGRDSKGGDYVSCIISLSRLVSPWITGLQSLPFVFLDNLELFDRYPTLT